MNLTHRQPPGNGDHQLPQDLPASQHEQGKDRPARYMGIHRARRPRRFLAAVVGMLAALTGVVVTSTPAHAASPPCSFENLWYFYDYNGDPEIQRRYGNLAEPFHYYVRTPAAWYSDGSPRWSCGLKYGSRGDAVRSLQHSLNRCYANPDSAYTPNAVYVGFALLTEDGNFGPRTKQALIMTQRWHGISADGSYGPQTAATIRFKISPMEGPWTLPMCHTLHP